MGKLILVRHGHTPLNGHDKNERLRSWLDIPLDQEGLDEAKQIAQSLARLPISAIISSDLKRAYQTAVRIETLTGAKIITTDSLRPWNLGIFAGQLLCEIIPFLALLKANPDLVAPNGESFRQFYERYSRCLMELLSRAEETDGYVVVVTHVRNFLAAKSILTDGNLSSVPVQGGPCTGAMRFIERTKDSWVIGDATELANPATTIPAVQPKDNILRAD